MTRRCLIVGNGPAGWAAGEAIRERDAHGAITIINVEGPDFYSRRSHPGSLLDYTCYGCHGHNRTRLQEEHEGVSNLSDCARCHPSGSKEGLEDEGDD